MHSCNFEQGENQGEVLPSAVAVSGGANQLSTSTTVKETWHTRVSRWQCNVILQCVCRCCVFPFKFKDAFEVGTNPHVFNSFGSLPRLCGYIYSSA